MYLVDLQSTCNSARISLSVERAGRRFSIGFKGAQRNVTDLVFHDRVPYVLCKFVHGLHVRIVFPVSIRTVSFRNGK